MMPVRRHQSYRVTANFDVMMDANDYDRDQTSHAPNMADENTLAWASCPSREFTAYLWPPSVYEAAQHVSPACLPSRLPDYIPFDNLVMPAQEPWQSPHAPLSTYRERSHNVELLQANNVNRAYYESSFAPNSPEVGSSSMINEITPPVSVHADDPERANSYSVSSRSALRCPICTGKAPFTGQYAQRNLNRHMERHNQCISSTSSRHIRCRQPGCVSTFGREDALLVHLRRSHPELNTPAAKKRKR